MEKYHVLCVFTAYHTASASPVVPNCGEGPEVPYTRHDTAQFYQTCHDFKGSGQAHISDFTYEVSAMKRSTTALTHHSSMLVLLGT